MGILHKPDAPGVSWLRRPYRGTNNPFPVPTGRVDSLTFVQALLAHGAKPNPRMKRAPDARYVGRDVVIDKGAHVAGATPFFLAARNDDVPLMRVLVAGGANPLEPNDEGTTPLMAAAGVSIRAKGENPGTPDEAAEAVQYCIDLGGDVNTVDKNGDTALHGAAHRGSNPAVQLLVDEGARLDVRNKVGWTPWRVGAGHRLQHHRDALAGNGRADSRADGSSRLEDPRERAGYPRTDRLSTTPRQEPHRSQSGAVQ